MQSSPKRFEQTLLRRAFLGIAAVYLGLLSVTVAGQLTMLAKDPQLVAVLACRLTALIVLAGAFVWGLFDRELPSWVPPGSFAVTTALAIVASAGLRGHPLLSLAIFLFDGIEFLLILGLFLRRRWVTLVSGAVLVGAGLWLFVVLPADTFPQVLPPDELHAGFVSLMVLGLSVTTGIVVISNDLSRKIGGRFAESFHQLQAAAYRDPDTGLPNGLQMEQDMAAWSRGHYPETDRWGLLGFRLDGLEELNETLGVEATSALVVDVVASYARAVAANARRYPSLGMPAPFQGLYRVESNLFLFFISIPPGAPTDFSQLRILDGVIREALDRGRPGLYLSVQGGYTLFPNDADTLPQLLRNLLNMLHSRRMDFRGRFAPFSQDKYQEHIRREALRLAMQESLAAHHFRLVFQPKFEVAGRRVTGFEALVRWQPLTGASIPPAEFIPLAEQTGQIAELTRQVVDLACDFLRRLEAEGFADFPVAINLSPGVLQADFLDRLILHLTDNGLGPLLQFEITEGSAMRLSEGLHEKLHRLRALGVTFAIDDFGTGYSNLGYLQELDADVLKIDKRFIDGIPAETKNATLVTILIQMAHAFEMKVVAEGVEQQDQWDYLQVLRCDEIQGFHGSPPLGPDEAVALLRQGR